MIQRQTRLTRKQNIRNIKRAYFFFFLSFVLVLLIIFLGIPSLVKMAIFLGNLKSTYTPVETETNLPPSPPRLKSMPEATNSAELKVEGYAEEGLAVEIYSSGVKEKEVVAEKDGFFLLDNLTLTEGRNEIYALAVDKSGGKSKESEKYIVVYDNTPPKLTIIEPADNSHFYGMQSKVVVKGETEENTSVTVNDHLAFVSSEGKFNYPYILTNGENIIKITATDKAGNKTEQEIKVWLE